MPSSLKTALNATFSTVFITKVKRSHNCLFNFFLNATVQRFYYRGKVSLGNE
jgi:hypothetical protein